MTNSGNPTDKKTPSGMLSPLCSFFNMIHPLSKEAIACVDNGTFSLSLAKGEFLVEPGNANDNLYFVVKGVVRGYIKEDGKEITTWINEENEIVGSSRNLGLDIPSEEYVQIIEDSRLVAIPNSLTDYLYQHFPEANVIGRILLQENYRGAEERAYISRIPSARKKYRRFVETRGALLNRIPLKYIASYLGMTLETLSRIRSKRGNF